MNALFDVNDIIGLKYESTADRSSRIEMDVGEGWLYVSADTTDDMNRMID